MESTILLNYNENTRKVEDEEKSRFIKSIVLATGAPIPEDLDEEWTDEADLSVDTRIKIRNFLSSFNIRVIDHVGDELEIYVDNELIAGWKKCEYVLKKNITAIDPAKKLYLEMKIDCWSVFEKE